MAGEATTPDARAQSAWLALSRERGWSLDASARLALQAVLVSRLVVWAAGLAALALFGHNHMVVAALDPNGASAPFYSPVANFALAPVARWDSVWYLVIAHNGYFSYQSSAMFPLYPLLLHFGSLIFRSELIVGLVVSVASLGGALYLLHRLVAIDLGPRVARTTVWLVALFPVSFFFSAVYTESLFLVLSLGAIYAARLDRWQWAGVLAALASATRSAGVVLLLPLLIMYLYGPRGAGRPQTAAPWWRPRHRVTPSIAWLALAPTGLVAFLVYLGVAHGDPLATFSAEGVFWGRHFAAPFAGLVQAALALPHDISSTLSGSGLPVGPGDPMTWNAHELIDLGFLAFALVGLAAAWRRVPAAYLAYAVALLAQPLSVHSKLEPLVSFSRYAMVVFPLFAGWALLLERRRHLLAPVLAVSAALLAVFSGLWAMWAWVA